MKLISMTDFALYYAGNMTYKDHSEKCTKYAKFLKQPLTLGMFIPCDLEGNVLEDHNEIVATQHRGQLKIYSSKYKEAKKRVLFDGFSFKSKDNFKEWCEDNNVTNVESMVELCFTLTPNAIKQLGL